MLTKRFLLSLAATIATTTAQYQGFNYASTNADGSNAYQSDFENLFNVAKGVVGASGFTSARLYTMIQAGTTNSPIEAIPAAIKTGTTLLLGLWASGGDAMFENELTALSQALSMYGSDFTNLIAGISVGSEDLYRDTPTGIANHAGIGAGPAIVSGYIKKTRALLRQASMTNIKVGHVDTWTAWVNGSNIAVVNDVDFLGLDAYPYFETTDSNSIGNAGNLFNEAYDATLRVAGGREVWITETGWPITGPLSGQATANVQNAKKYWDDVACKYVGKTNTWWYTLYDNGASPSFGIVGATLSNQPAYDLKCPKHAAASHSAKPSHTQSHSQSHTQSHSQSHTQSPKPTHHASPTKTHHTSAKTPTSHKEHPSHASKHHHKHHQSNHSPTGKKSGAAHKHDSKHHSQASSSTPVTGAQANVTNAPSGAGVVQPSILLMAGMLAFWCL